jgi:prepilin-type N-terminal cleavage/methylation domain-containing protein
MARNKGFTLLEVLFAMFILSISFVTLLAAESQGIDMCSQSKFITTSTLLAEQHIAEVKASLNSNKEQLVPGQKTGDFGADYPGYTYIEDVEATMLSGYYEYSITVIWGTGKRALKNQLMTYYYAGK